jgi:hypothetical protein
MNERIVSILKSPWTTHTVVGFIGIGGGVGIGYLLWGREPQYEVAVPAEPPVEGFIDVEGLANARQIIEDERYNSGIFVPETQAEVTNDSVIVRAPVEEEPELIEVNVFEAQDPTWDWEKEIENRDETKPHVIHRDEFYQNERDYTQTTLTYYAGDDIMADEDDSPIFDYAKLTGPLSFGKGSGDPNAVLIRNNERRAEYEVLKDPGRFEVEVLGLDYQEKGAAQDLKHSKVLRFRED